MKATDPAGNSSTSSVPVTVDTTPPAITAKLDPASDSGTKGDGVTNDNTPTISGTGSAGDTITITTPTGESITTTVKPDGTWTATPTQPLPDGNNTISVKATDPAGNSSTSSVPVTVDTTPPAVTAQLDPASDSGTPGDGITNDNTPTLSGTGEPGNTITVTSPTGEVMTTTVKPDGTWSVTPTQPLPDGAANFPVTATDPAGNTTSSNVPVTIDSAVPNAGAAPTVTITEDANNDGFINASESQGPVDLKVAFDPNTVAVGDTVKVTANGVTQDVVISAADKANGYVTATTPLPAQDTMLNVSAVIVDAAGNSSAPGTDSAKVDRSDLSGVSVSITEDANNDGVINQSELQGSVGVTVTLPAGAIAGDLLTVTANGNATQAITLTPAQIAAGQVIVELQAPASGSTLTVSAQVTDAAGNQSNVASDSARIDTTAPALTAQLNPSSDSGTPGDGITNDNTPTISGTGEPGNTITVTSPTGEVLTTTVKPDGTWSVTPTQPLPDGAANFPVTATDPAGNSTSSSVPVTIDTTPPAASITLNSITADNVINATEAGQQIPVTGSVGGDAKAGDTVTLTVNGKTFTGTVAADKTFSINVPGSDLLADPDTTVDASVTTTDAAGNSRTVSTSEGYSLGTPPTLTAQLDPASDSGKQGDGITSDSTPTISGTTTPGATVSVSSPTGEVLTTTAGPDGTWSVTPTQPLPNGAANFPVTATSPAGDVTSTTVPVTIDTTAPTLTAKLDPASDSGTQGDGITNDNTPTLSGTGEPGNTITVTSPTGEVMTTTVKPDGTWSVTPTQPLPDGAANFPVTTTDPAGNSTSSSVPVTIDSAVPNAGAAPTVTITEDANNDGYINASEASGPVDLKVAFDPNTVTVGDTVKVTANGVTQDVVISAADKANGYVTATTPLPANGSTLDVSAVIVDAAGNSSLPGSDSAIVDTTALSGLGIQILEDENNDGYIVSSELKDNDIDVRVTLPADAAVGDTLTVSGSGNTHQVFTLTAAQLAAGFIDVSFNPTADRTTFVASAQLTDAAGNQGGPVQDSATIVVGAPGAPIVVIGEDANNDGYINAAELQGPINASVILPATAKAGDTLQTSVNGVAQAPIVLTAADISNGSVTLPGIANPGEGQTLTVTAQVSNPAGIAGASGSDSAIIDTTPPAASVTLNANITPDDVINAAESKQDIAITGSVGGDAKAGDTVTLTVNGKTFTGTVAADKTFSIPVPGADLVADSDKTIDASVTTTDAAGNSTTATASEGYSVDTTAPTLTAVLDPSSDSGTPGDGITNDNTPTLSGTGEPGNTITVTSPTGEVMTTTVKPDGTWSVTPTQPLPDGAANFPVIATDPAGNSTSSSVPVTIDTTPPAASVTLNANITPDDVINAAESKQDIAITGSVGGDAKAGDTVTLTVNGKTFTGTVAADKTFSIPVPGADLVADSDKTIDASVTTTDAAGNSTTATASEGYSVDITAPTLTAQLDPASDSGTPGDGITNDNTPTISGTGEPGNTITVTTPVGETLTTTVKPDGTWSVTPTQPLPDGAANFPVTATDPAGNSTSSSVPVTIDTTPPAASITLNANITPDDVINAAESKQDIAITGSVGGDAKAGDTVTLTVNGKTFTGTVAADKTFSIPVPGADLVADSDKTIDASVTTTDAAGNSSTATASEGYSVDTTAPTLTAKLDPASDSGTQGDGLTNDNTPTLSGTGEPGNTITVTSPTGEVMTTTVKPDGTWSVTPTQPLPDGAANFPVTATDPAGNTTSSSVPVTIDSAVPNAGAAPTVTITEDANNDGFINASESQGPVDLKVAFDPNTVAVGDTVKVTANGVTQDVVISAADKANGYVTATTPLPAQDTMLNVSAVIVDAAGNSSAPGTDSAKVDRSDLSGVGISITEDANNDGVINQSELQGSVGVTVTLPAGAIAGDLLTVTANGNATQAITLTPAQIAAGQVTVELQAPASGSTLNVSAQVTDAAGNQSNVASDSARIDTTPPTVTAKLDPASDSGTQGDGITNDNTPTISGTGEPGNTITVTSPTGEVMTTTVKPDGTWSVTPTQPLPDGAANFPVTATDPAGNSTSSSVPVTIDTTPPAASITLNSITADNVINATEAGQQIPVTGSVGGDAKAGDTVTLTVNGKTFTGTVAADKTFSINVPGSDLLADPDTTVDASVTTTDAAGNSTTVSDSEDYSLGTPPTLTALLDPASDSGKQGDGITSDSTPTISGTTTPGATVSVSSPTGEVLTTTAGPDGTWSITPTQPLPNGAANFPVTATSPAGDVTSTTVPVTIDTTAPTLTAKLDPASDSGTQGDGITNDNTPTLSGTGEPGNTITVTTPVGETLTTTVKPDGTWSVTPTQPLPDGAANFPVTATDPAGNSTSSSVPVTIDSAVPNAGAAPTVTITEDANNDGYINASEASGPVDLKVAFDPNTVAVGDTVKVTANGVTQDVVISAADKANGYVTATTPLPANGSTLDVSAVIVDAAGNSSLPGSDSAIVDTTALSGLGIQILEDENNDGYIVSSELKDNDIDVRVTLPADAAVGDTLTVSGSGNTHQVFTLTAAQLAAGFIDVSFNPTADRTTFVASAQLTDAAGNQGGPVQDSATIVVGAPGAPIVVIGEDANNDGYINAAETARPDQRQRHSAGHRQGR
ncbi:antitoxin (DNA-binding transcriptional repressor) of toxin-antitoxin stability system [Vogesella perlucida]|nr:antitoxin (DNA-binding transcriptional repressor) of toxin-antitoxin stability system [Vogesella perlucida]